MVRGRGLCEGGTPSVDIDNKPYYFELINE